MEWNEACEKVQEALWTCFFNEEESVLVNHYPVKEEENWIYWWHAHALDVLLDGYARTGDEKYRRRFWLEYEGTFRKNGNTYLHNWYDDMEWMTLALLRAWDMTKDVKLKEQIFLIWEDIKTAWNNTCSGGMAWKKDQTDYKNTPANAPAAMIAFRLYQRFKNPEDLEWGRKIFEWNKEYLMDKETCFIWDGMNRLGDGEIDKDWKFTYCQGVMMGAALEYYRITADAEYLTLAVRIAERAVEELADEEGIFPYEGPDDCGLFRGIFFRNLYDLAMEAPENQTLSRTLENNAECIQSNALNKENLAGGDWKKPSSGTIDLAQHLSAVMVLEMAAKRQSGKKWQEAEQQRSDR